MRGWLVAILVVVSGCVFGGDDTSGGPYVSLSDVLTAGRDAECQYLARCNLIGDEASCAGMRDPITFIDPFTLDFIRHGEVRYRGDQMAKCLDTLANQTCEPDDIANRTALNLCLAGVIGGTFHAGASCTADVQCISQACSSCGGGGQVCCLEGTCVGDIAPPRFALKQLGQACMNTFGFDDCEPDAFCDVNSGRCVATLAAGITCNSSRQCGVGLACSGSSGPIACQRLPHVGEHCTGQCSEVGTYCNAQGVCANKAHVGGSCSQGEMCDPFSDCDFNTGLCKQGPGLGESCFSGVCFAAGTFCNPSTQVCETQVDEGEHCSFNDQCTTGICDNTTLECTTMLDCGTSGGGI